MANRRDGHDYVLILRGERLGRAYKIHLFNGLKNLAVAAVYEKPDEDGETQDSNAAAIRMRQGCFGNGYEEAAASLATEATMARELPYNGFMGQCNVGEIEDTGRSSTGPKATVLRYRHIGLYLTW